MSHDFSPSGLRLLSGAFSTRLRQAALPAACAAAVALLGGGVVMADGVSPGDRASFTATAYCDRGTTKAGVKAQQGVAAADPAVLPVGSVVRVDSPSPEHQGIYTVMDTGGKVVGRRIDLFVGDCQQAKRFGLQRVLVRVLRLGWNPKASARPSVLQLRFASYMPGGAATSAVAAGAPEPDDLSDGAITAKVKSRLALDDTIRSRDIHVATKDAVVTLTGQVASVEERDKAVKLAGDTEGVKSVVDRIEIKK